MNIKTTKRQNAPNFGKNLKRAVNSKTKPQTSASPVFNTKESFESSSVVSTAVKSAVVGAAYGALVGGATSHLYSNTGLMTATAGHMGGIVAGGGLGAGVLGKALGKKAEPPAAMALGALAGAGVTWATSAFGILGNPAVGAAAGLALGAFFGAVGGAIVASEGTNDRSTAVAETPNPSFAKVEEQKFPKTAWTGIQVAYGLAGTAILAGAAAKGIAGTLTPKVLGAGALVAGGAYLNAYLIHKTTQQ